jgi:drug/metabolite transporter (DMT)-like permease
VTELSGSYAASVTIQSAAPRDPAQPTTSDRRSYAVAAAGVTVLLWASAFVAIRHVGEQFSPGPLSLGRLLVASLVLGLVLLPRTGTWRRPTAGDWRLLTVCGVLWFGAYNVALNAAEQRVDAGTAAMLVAIGPLLIALVAGVTLGEGFPRPVVGGLGIAFVGVALIALPGLLDRTAGGNTAGVALGVVAAVTYAIGVVAQKPLLSRLSALQVTWLACLIGTAVCLPFAGRLLDELAAADASTTAWLVYLGVFPTAVAFTTWAYALSHTTAGRMGATTYLVPPIAIGLGWLLLGETPAVLAVAGGVVCLVGVAVSRRRAS